MHAAEQASGSAAMPTIRTDWLADVAWRLATHGLDALRAPGFAVASLTDVVDGQPWRLEATRLSAPWETAVELDADLYLPSDGSSATLRAGFDLVPAWEAGDGPVTRVRVEIGPRGAVTFDPENWMLTVPARAAKPAVRGVEAGSWEPRGTGGTAAARGGAADLHGLDLDLIEVPAHGSERREPELRLAGAQPAPPQGRLAKLLGGGRRRRREPAACLVVRSEGPITAAAEDDPAALDRADRLTAVSAVHAHHDHVAITGAEGTLVLRGARLQTEVQRLVHAARG